MVLPKLSPKYRNTLTPKLTNFINDHYSGLITYSQRVSRGAEYSADVVGDVIVGVGLMNGAKIDALIDCGKLLGYLHSAIYIQHRTSKSSICRRYRFNEVIVSVEYIDNEPASESAPTLLTEIEDWFEREIVRLKVEGYTTSDISEMTGITPVNIDRAFIKAKNKLKAKVK